MNIDFLKDRLEKHGELHLVVEEHESVMADSDEDYIGVRSGNTMIDTGNGVITVDDGSTVHTIDIDSVVYFHAPRNFPD